MEDRLYYQTKVCLLYGRVGVIDWESVQTLSDWKCLFSREICENNALLYAWATLSMFQVDKIHMGPGSYKNKAFIVFMLEVIKGDQLVQNRHYFFVSILSCGTFVFLTNGGFGRIRFSSLSTCQKIGWVERLQNDLICVEPGVKPYLSQ